MIHHHVGGAGFPDILQEMREEERRGKLSVGLLLRLLLLLLVVVLLLLVVMLLLLCLLLLLGGCLCGSCGCSKVVGVEGCPASCGQGPVSCCIGVGSSKGYAL